MYSTIAVASTAVLIIIIIIIIIITTTIIIRVFQSNSAIDCRFSTPVAATVDGNLSKVVEKNV